MRVFIFIFLLLLGCSNKYTVYRFDNGDDYYIDGLRRVEDSQKRIGYQDETGKIVIKPSFKFGFPFDNGKAKVTDCGNMREVPGSGGEHKEWISNNWYYIDKTGKRLP